MNKLKNRIFKILIELFIFDKVKRSKIKARDSSSKQKLLKYCPEATDLPPLNCKKIDLLCPIITATAAMTGARPIERACLR